MELPLVSSVSISPKGAPLHHLVRFIGGSYWSSGSHRLQLM